MAREIIQFENSAKNGGVNGNIRFKNFFEQFIGRYAKLYLKPNTLANYKRDLKRINAALGHIKLKALNPGHISQFYANLQEGGVNEQTKGKLQVSSVLAVHRTLSAPHGKAVKWGSIEKEPA